MVRTTRSMTAAVPHNRRNLSKAKAVPPKHSRKAAKELKRMALNAVDVDNILRVKREAMEAVETFPYTAKKKKVPEEEGEEKKKKKKVVTYLVSQGYIDLLKEGLFHCVDEIPQDKLAQESQLFRDSYRANMFLTEKLQACQQVLLDQYNTYGYAYDAKEVTDDEDEDEGEGDGVVVARN